MSFLDNLFQQTVPELPVATTVITADSMVEPGFLYRIAGSDDPITVTLAAHGLEAVAGVRLALKIYAPAPAPPGGTLAVAVPAGQQIEGDDGELGASVALASQVLGLYREWLCDANGSWWLVGGDWQ